MVNFYSGFLTPEAARAGRDREAAYRRFSGKYKDEAELKAAWTAYGKEHPVPPAACITSSITSTTSSRSPASTTSASGRTTTASRTCRCNSKTCPAIRCITQELLNRGYKKEAILKVLGGNALRALRGAEKAAKRRVRRRRPLRPSQDAP